MATIMLPRSRTPLMRTVNRHRALPLLPVLLSTTVILPCVVWIIWTVSFSSGKDREGSPPSSLLHRIRVQGPEHEAAAVGSASEALPSKTPAAVDTAHTWTSAASIAAAAKYRQDVVLDHKKRAAVPARSYVIEPEPHDMRAQHRKVLSYLGSSGFKAVIAARQSAGQRGIIINAGGPDLITSAAVTLRVLRTELHCTLPVELVWHKPHEMDAVTLAALQAKWGPMTGVNLSSILWPEHHRPVESGDGSHHTNKFIGKVRSLTVSSFASALLLDADNLPLADPAGLWEDAAFKSEGNLFWPDFWSGQQSQEAQEIVYDIVGLKHPEAANILAAGKGRLQRRDTESGQLLLDLVRHADVAQWALWINTFGDSIYKAVWGDKDTYGLAFAVAGKAHEFTQIQVPPGGAFTWRPDKLLIKATGAKQPGWQLAGMVQFDAAGQPAFLHRTMNKFSWKGEAWPVELLTGPLPARWIHYYLSEDALGPTVGVPYDYVVPRTAFVTWTIPQSVNISRVEDNQVSLQTQEVCPTATFTTYWRLREHAVPLGSQYQLQGRCTTLLHRLLGPLADSYISAGLHQQPELLAIGRPNTDQIAYKQLNPNPLVPREEIPDSTAVLAWTPDYAAPHGQAVETTVNRVFAASYDALSWIRTNADNFPLLHILGAEHPGIDKHQ